MRLGDLEDVLPKLTTADKARLLSGAGSCSTVAIPRLGIPQLNTSDGPHGVRGGGGRFFNPPPGYQLPCGTAMGATFDASLIQQAGVLLGDESRRKDVHVALAPVVCIQRSPLLGRGFEAFGEDPVLSGVLAAHIINGIQKQGVGACIKHYAAHDQSAKGLEDNVQMSERTLREVHLLPFQIALAGSKPVSFMSAYQKINGIHASEDPLLIETILRREWGYDGLVMSDWWGTYSTSEALNAGLDLEMPGPSVWRGKQLTIAIEARKVSIKTVDESVQRLLKLIVQTRATLPPAVEQGQDSEESRQVLRKISADSIVMLKNDLGVLPLSQTDNASYGLIGEPFERPLTCGGGSSETAPFYISKPIDAFRQASKLKNVRYTPGCDTRRWTPLIEDILSLPGSKTRGLLLEWFAQDPAIYEDSRCLHSTITSSTSMYFSQMHPENVPPAYYIRIRTTFRSQKTCRYRLALSVCGRAKLSINGKEVIDLWNSHPKKTDDTPCFNKLSMERCAAIDIKDDEQLELEIIMTNQGLGPRDDPPGAGGVRLGGREVVDDDEAMESAVRLASEVDIPIVMAGLGADYEYEASDRTHLSLPRRADEMIQRICDANPNTVVILQAGMPVTMPWIDSAHTVLHTWLGGQETGNAISDVLFGNVNPSGRLSLSFPKRLQDTPTFLNFAKSDRTITYGEGVFVGYRYYDMLECPPLFYFGFGLSYTRFEYSDLVIPSTAALDTTPDVRISLNVTNVGAFDGAEVIQVYVADPQATVQRPKKELKAFAKVYLRKGEKTSCVITLNKYAFSYWSEEHSQWLAESGEFAVVIARSADPRDIVMKQNIILTTSLLWSGI